MMKLDICIKKKHGFTLVELMIVVAIVAVLAAFAYPAYTEHLKKGYRAEAQATMMEAAQMMQRYYSTQHTYDNKKIGSLPTRSPANGTLRYNITYSHTNALIDFTISAKPVGKDDCGTLSITNTGFKEPTTPAKCW